MSRVIRRVPPPAEHIARHVCARCGSEIEFDRSDVWYGDQRDPGEWVACPVCKATIVATKLPWKVKT